MVVYDMQLSQNYDTESSHLQRKAPKIESYAQKSKKRYTSKAHHTHYVNQRTVGSSIGAWWVSLWGTCDISSISYV